MMDDETFTLILSGKVTVVAGESDNVRIELSERQLRSLALEPTVKAETALEKINAALFPAPVKRKDHFVDSGAYYNLEGAIIDLKRLKADPVCIRTIERVQKQIHEVAKVLQKAGIK